MKKPLFFILFFPLIVLANINLSIYMAADNSLESAYEKNVNTLQNVSSDLEKIDINVFVDTQDSAYQFFINNGDITLIYAGENVNSGDPDVISDFFINSFGNNNDNVNIMVLWDHGNDWYNDKSKSIMYDNNPNDFISIINGEFRQIFENVCNYIGRKIDIVVLDACNMQSIEILYEMSDFVKYSIGSEVIVPYYGITESVKYDEIDKLNNPEIIAKEICNNYFEFYSDSLDSLQISYINIELIKSILQDIKINSLLFQSPRINTIEISILNEIVKEYIYNLSDRENLTGIKMFLPQYYELFDNYYEDYIKLKIDNDYEIIKYEFPFYEIPDTFAPLMVDSFECIPKGNSNYQIIVNKPFDFNSVNNYIFKYFNYSFEYFTYYNDFSDRSINYEGEYSFNESYFVSKPYSLFTKNIKIYIENKKEKLLGINIMGKVENTPVIIVDENNDTTKFLKEIDYNKWNTFYTEIYGNVFLEFNSQNDEYIYIDNLILFSLDSIKTISCNSNEYLLHKLEKGIYKFYIYTSDEFGNTSMFDTLFEYTVSDNVCIYIYPNPVLDKIYIANDFTGNFKVILYSGNGLKIKEFEGITYDNNIEIDISTLNLANGIYYVILENNNNFYKTKFFKK